MATSAENELPAGLQPPPEVPIPPKQIREQCIKFGNFIVRSGARGVKYEEDINKREPGKYIFLNKDEPYNLFFEWYKQMVREGKAGPQAAAGDAQAVAKKPKGPAEPAKFRFSARMPNISAKDLEILKLTALFTAKNGENWVRELRNQQSVNPQFDFLRPTHSYFTFFRAISDQYKILLEEEATVQARMEELRHNIQDRFHILERARGRAEYIKHVTHEKEKEEKKVEDEKKEYAEIDWHDFGIIATVTFDEADDLVDLPAPTTLNDIQSASLDQKAQFSLSRRIEEARPDEETYYNATQASQPAPAYNAYPVYSPSPVPTPAFTPMAPPVQPVYPPPPPMAGANYIPLQPNARQDEDQQLARERERAQAAAKTAPGPGMRIRNDYVPRAVAKKAGVQMVLCPNCNTNIPANEYDEHIRIELLDSRWKEQKEKSEARYATTINTADVAGNLKRFASQRNDIYDSVTGEPITEEEANRRKRAALSYDGQPDPVRDAARVQQMAQVNIQDQLRALKEKHTPRGQ